MTATVTPPAAPADRPERSRRAGGRAAAHLPVVVLVGAWLASRVVYALLGVGFDTDPLRLAYQIIDRDLLEHHLVTSVWHYHAQPPLFNLLIGLALKLPLTPTHTLGFVFRAIGLSLALLMYRLGVELGVSRTTAAIVAGIFTCAPPAVLYENYLFYTLPVATLLCAAAVCLVRYLRTRGAGSGVGLFASVTALGLTRATYHLVWVAAVIAFVAWATRRAGGWRTTLVVALPTVLVLGLYVKNYVMFDTFSSSSWLGMNLARVVLAPAPNAEIEAMIRDGKISPQARIYPFEDLDTFHASHAPTGVAVLDRRWRTRTDPNLNNLDYIKISNRYTRDSLTFLRAHPGEYASTVVAATRMYFLPTSEYPFVEKNAKYAAGLRRVWWVVPDAQPRSFHDPRGFFNPTHWGPDWLQTSWAAIGAYALVIVVWPITALLTRRRRTAGDRRALDGPARMALGFIAATVAFAFVTGVTLELGENNRFRFETDPLVWVATVALVSARGGAAAVPPPRPVNRPRCHEPGLAARRLTARLPPRRCNGRSTKKKLTAPEIVLSTSVHARTTK